MRAKAQLSRIMSPYRSKAEEAWAVIGSMWIEDEFKLKVARELYEPFSFNLPGGSYTPDFLYILEDGSMVFCEVKGSKLQKNYRDARSKLRAAAELHPWFFWTQATQAGRGAWDFEVIKP